MPSACGLHCSLCNVIYGTRIEWLNHLLHPPHQTGTRAECGGWDLQVQECVLVVYASFPVATVTLLQFFIKKFKNTIVTDFVWSEKRPRVGILVFESRDKVNEILEEIGCRDVRVDNQLVRLKKGTDFIDLEWDEFIQDFQSTSSYSVELVPRETTPEATEKKSKTKKVRKQKKVEAGSENNTSKEENEEKTQSDVNPGLSHLKDTSDLMESVAKRRKKKKKLDNDDNAVKMDEIKEPQPQTEVKLEKGLPNSKGFEQFDSIRREIEIPDQDYEWALDMMEKLREIFAMHYPTCKVYMFRHWFLKLLSEGTNELLFYVDLDGVLDGHEAKEPPSARNVTVSDMRNLFTNPDVQHILPGIINLWGEEGAERHYERRAFRYKQLSTGRKFSLVNNPRYLAEVQTCRVAKYLLDFDPRAMPFLFLTVIFYWARRNDARTSLKLYPYRYLSHAFAPEPSALIWMVIQFLCQKKIIPTPREILQRPHKQLLYSFKNRSFDIGFSMDPKLAKKSFRAANSPAPSSNQFLIQLLELAVGFFNLYGNLCNRWEEWFLNTLDGEILKKDDFLFKTPGVDFETKYPTQDLAQFRSIAISCKAKPAPGVLATAKMAILHPLVIGWTIMLYYKLFYRRTQYQMQTAAKEIGEALQARGQEWQHWFDNGDFSLEKLLENGEPSPPFFFKAGRYVEVAE